ncbi:MAG: hypothetical protein HOY79_43070 [Streptomyces sp.]|nr:hypothetical protein [Streptomyces sp.]
MSHIVDELRADLASAHLKQQAGRFARLAVVAFAAQLATLGTGHLGWDAVGALAVGAVETAYRQWAPTVPWKTVAARLRDLLPGGAPAASPIRPTTGNSTSTGSTPSAPSA